MLDSTVVCRRALGCEWGGNQRPRTGSKSRSRYCGVVHLQVFVHSYSGHCPDQDGTGLGRWTTSDHLVLDLAHLPPLSRTLLARSATPYGSRSGGLWGSTALIAPDEPRCRLGPKKDTESVSAS